MEYHDGSGFVWDDSLSGAKRNGVSKLESTVEMSQWVHLLHKPMSEVIRKMARFAEDECQPMQASGW
ncbi:hypothetical protein QDY68_06730 [Kingella negevensis]|uniref:hypothetical protein n=1 Tax=Kingella negevensis TaxID=1522312 RepID=UPI00254CDC50|nr:hypothetical protein [Kingella negevensis]MDK4710079.1 hypothetical protein [Kingella negevensis]